MIVLPAGTEAHASEIGNKASALFRLTDAGLPVPPFFCVSARAISTVGIADINCGLSALGAEAVAVRSSAIDEDRPGASFAGMYTTRLNVIGARNVKRALDDIDESASSPAAIAYRQQRGISSPPQIAAAIQKMIRADASGVIFTRDPIANSDSVIIEGCWGLGEALAGGAVTPDRWVLSRDGCVLSAMINDKDVAAVPQEGGGTTFVEVDEKLRRRPCLNPGTMQQLLKFAVECERLFGCPQDIEWAISQDELWLLQSRPISSL
jgi:pyruvate,water dikinase